jgi:hypothetical protein
MASSGIVIGAVGVGLLAFALPPLWNLLGLV